LVYDVGGDIWLLRGLLRKNRQSVWSVSITVLGVPNGMVVL